MSDELEQRVEIELLKKDVITITALCGKFDVAIDKIQEIASNLSRMLSLQEQRLEIHEKTTKDMENILEMRRVEHNNDIKELHSRITTVNRELTEKIEESESKILSELKSLREEIVKDDDKMNKRIFNIESWKWMVMGGLFVLGWTVSKILPTLKLF